MYRKTDDVRIEEETLSAEGQLATSKGALARHGHVPRMGNYPLFMGKEGGKAGHQKKGAEGKREGGKTLRG